MLSQCLRNFLSERPTRRPAHTRLLRPAAAHVLTTAGAGKCLDVNGSVTTAGTPCDGQGNQRRTLGWPHDRDQGERRCGQFSVHFGESFVNHPGGGV